MAGLKRASSGEEIAYRKAVGAKIREVRLARGLTQQALADEIRMCRSQLCIIEKGKRVPSLFDLVTIAKVLNVSVVVLARMYPFANIAEVASCVVQKKL